MIIAEFYFFDLTCGKRRHMDHNRLLSLPLMNPHRQFNLAVIEHLEPVFDPFRIVVLFDLIGIFRRFNSLSYRLVGSLSCQG